MPHHVRLPTPLTICHLRASQGGGGGPEKTIVETGARLDKASYRYLIAYLRKPNRDVAPVAQAARAKALEFREFPGAFPVNLRQLFALRRMVHGEGVHILHSHDYKSDLYGVLLRRLGFRGVLMTTIHGWTSQRSRKSAFYTWVNRRMLRCFDAVAAVSEPIAAMAKSCGARRVERIHNGVDVEVWTPTALPGEAPPFDVSAGAPTVGFVGRLSKEKGALVFVRTAARVLAQTPTARFVVAGDGPQAAEARALAHALGVDAAITFIGRQPLTAMPALYRALDVVLSTSHTEGMPNTLLEALATGRPVVATAVGGVSELIEHERHGLLAADGDVEALATHTCRLLRDPDLAARLGLNGRARVTAEFSFSARTARMTALQRELASRNQWVCGLA